MRRPGTTADIHRRGRSAGVAGTQQSVRVPEVYGVGSDRDYSFLLLEYQQLKPLDAHGAYRLGQQLAHLHQWSEQPQFGLDFDSDLTTTPQPNAGSAAGRNSSPSSASAGSCSWRRRKA